MSTLGSRRVSRKGYKSERSGGGRLGRRGGINPGELTVYKAWPYSAGHVPTSPGALRSYVGSSSSGRPP